MGKYAYLNLTQKMIKIRKMVPKLLRKRYSEEVPYDFVRLDDVYEYLTPALNKYGVDFEVLGEASTQLDASGNPAYLTPFGNMWRYEADLKLCWTNADHPEEKNYSDIHVVGTNEVPDKAKGAAWSYGLKYYLLNKFNIVQATTEDPDMRGPAPDGDKTKKEKSEEPKKPAKKQNQNAVQTEPKKKEAKEESENPPKSDSAFTSTKETGQSLKQKETTLKTVRNGNSRSSKKAVTVSDDSFDLEISPDEIRDARKEEDENLPGQMQFGMEEKDLEESFLEENESEEETLGTSEEPLEETADEMPDEVPEDTERFEAEAEEISGETEEEEFHFVRAEDENPFADDSEEETDEGFGMESEEEELERARKVMCNFGLFSGKTLGEMMENPKGADTVRWMATGYYGSNMEMVNAAKIIVAHEKQNRLAA